jgi:hypothetical protein
MGPALRLMIFDASCRGRGAVPGLSDAWSAGSGLYRASGSLDRSYGAHSWSEALEWLATVEPARQIAQIQFWGHGKWGEVRIDGEPLSVASLREQHEHADKLRAIRKRLTGHDALWWFRSCETFGAAIGHEFAKRWVDYFGCRAAGHTYIIGFWQSGLHSLSPGEQAYWPDDEGLAEGTPEAPQRARWSRPWHGHTISCLSSSFPPSW